MNFAMIFIVFSIPKQVQAILLKRSNLKLLILTFLLAMSFSASATTLNKLFEVGVPVMSQSGKERKEASKQAFEILLVRITGRRDLTGTEIGQMMINNARQYVSSFRYEKYEPVVFELPDTSTFAESDPAQIQAESVETNVEEVEKPPKPTQKLVVSFDEKAVKNSLWKQKLPVWGKTRPSTLLWVAIQDNERRMLLDANELTPLLSYIQKQAEKRGVPILFPLLDLEDQININVTDVWGAFKEPVKNASSRYQPEAILTARLFLDPFGVWQTRWTLYQGSDEIDWQVSAPTLEVAAIDGLDHMADKLAQKYAHISSVQDDTEFLIYISDVKNLKDFARVNKYLAGLSTIKKADLAQIKGEELAFRLDLRSSAKALKQAIKLGKVLLTADDPFAPEANNENRLSYRLMP